MFKIADNKWKIHTVPLEDIRVDAVRVTVFIDALN